MSLSTEPCCHISSNLASHVSIRDLATMGLSEHLPCSSSRRLGRAQEEAGSSTRHPARGTREGLSWGRWIFPFRQLPCCDQRCGLVLSCLLITAICCPGISSEPVHADTVRGTAGAKLLVVPQAWSSTLQASLLQPAPPCSQPRGCASARVVSEH